MNVPAARLRRAPLRQAVDLFPFLGIVVCVIGVVVLLLSGLSAVGALGDADRYKERQLLAAIGLLERWVEAQKGLREHDAESTPEPVEKSPEQLRRELVALVAQAKAVEAELDPLSQRVAEARKRQSDGVNTIPLPESFKPGSVRPIFVECHNAGLTVYRTDSDPIVEDRVPFDSIKTSTLFARFVKETAVKAQAGEPLVVNLLVRPAGVKAYDRAMSQLMPANVPVASVPIAAAGKIAFRRARNL